LLVHAGLIAVFAASAASPSWRIEAPASDPAETALRRCLEADNVAYADVSCFVGASEAHPGTVASGLARLVAGLRLLDMGDTGGAVAHLGHSDVARTRLRDWALRATARAQETQGKPEAAARSYLLAAGEPESAVACDALPRAAEALRTLGRHGEAVSVLEDALDRCPGGAPRILSSLGDVRLAAGDPKGAARALDRLDRDYPASTAARAARPRLRALARHVLFEAAGEKAKRQLRKGELLLESRRTSEAFVALDVVDLGALPADEADRARVLLGRAALRLGRRSQGRSVLGKVGPSSPHAAEAAYHLATDESRRHGSVEPFRRVADAHAGTSWAEEALLDAGNYYQKDALDEAAVPWYRRLALEYPSGTHVERAAWRVGWGDFRAKRFGDAAQVLERTARLRPPSRFTPGLLYWAARSRLALGQTERARYLLGETVQRYKNAYHGFRARETLLRMGSPDVPPPLVFEAEPAAEDLPEGKSERLRQLLLADLFDEAAEELDRLGDSPRVRSTLAWVEWRRGRFLQAIVTMKRAHPEWVSAAGDRLPDEVWRILYPLRYEEELRRQAESKGLDASLVAALILQESSFDPAALSGAGARGLMQVMPATGRSIARAKGVRFLRSALHDPRTSLDFGTHYLRQMSDRFGGDVEKVLAAYNAGPHRVDAWTALRPGLSAEEFIESIPFTETRQYVMLVLANREHYRRLYQLDRSTPGPVLQGLRP